MYQDAVDDTNDKESDISYIDLAELFTFYPKLGALKDHRKRKELYIIQEKCTLLFDRDYDIYTIDNKNGELCSSYPINLIVPVGHKKQKNIKIENDTTREEEYVVKGRDWCQNLKKHIQKSSSARARTRFPFPVFLVGNRSFCRSGGLAEAMEIRMKRRSFLSFSGLSKEISELRQADKSLLKFLGVECVCDLMVQNTFKVAGVAFCTSEKACTNIYSRKEFDLMAIPFPGCEFFKKWREHKYNAEISVPWKNTCPLYIENPPVTNMKIDWTLYPSWNLDETTQHYLMLLIDLLTSQSEGGILLHCISGWDRTPLLTSLLRFSLWADGVIHASLSAKEILYLSISYDWLLFGHNLIGRSVKGEEIFYFCLRFIEKLQKKEFSVHRQKKKKKKKKKKEEMKEKEENEKEEKKEGEIKNNRSGSHDRHRTRTKTYSPRKRDQKKKSHSSSAKRPISESFKRTKSDKRDDNECKIFSANEEKKQEKNNDKKREWTTRSTKEDSTTRNNSGSDKKKKKINKKKGTTTTTTTPKIIPPKEIDLLLIRDIRLQELELLFTRMYYKHTTPQIEKMKESSKSLLFGY